MELQAKQRFSTPLQSSNVFLPIFLSSMRHRPVDIVHLPSEHHEITKEPSSTRAQAGIRYRSRELPGESELPSEIKLIKDRNGATIYVVGTAHLSRDSNHQVLEIIDRVKPDRVMVELCNERQGLMYMSEKAIMDQPDITWSDLVNMAKAKGIGAALVQLSLMGATDHAKHELQTIPGGEFRFAKQQCDRVPNCKVVLGDRRMSVTFRRLTAAMSTWEKIRFVAGTIWDSIWVKEEEIEEMKQEDTLEKLMEEMKVGYPSAARVILDERDIYLTGMLQATARSPQKVPKDISESGLVPPVIVAVVGIGHQKGITRLYNEKMVTKKDLDELNRTPEQEPVNWPLVVSMIGGNCALAVVLCCWGCRKLTKVLFRKEPAIDPMKLIKIA